MDSEHGSASMEHKKALLEAGTAKDDEHGLSKPGNEPIEENAWCSSSSCSDTSSEEDFFQLDAIELSKATARQDEMPSNNLGPPQHGENAQSETAVVDSAGKQEMKGLCQHESILVASIQAGQVPSVTPLPPCAGPGSDYVGAKQSPPLQVMGKSDGFDPNRIPSSVFMRTKSTAPMEWSVASNESLFSIQIGRSGDLTAFYNGQWDGYPPISPLPGSSPAKRVGTGQGLAEPSVAEAANAEAMKDILRAAAEEKGKVLTGGMPRSDSRRSDGSVNSYRSFAFPILTDGKIGSIKVESLHQQTPKELPDKSQFQMEPPNTVPGAAEKKCFPCFSCCTFCC